MKIPTDEGEAKVNRRRFLKTVGLILLALTATSCAKFGEKTVDKKPNIVFILADDMG